MPSNSMCNNYVSMYIMSCIYKGRMRMRFFVNMDSTNLTRFNIFENIKHPNTL